MSQTDGARRIDRIFAKGGGRVSIEFYGGHQINLNPEVFARFDIHPGDLLDEETLCQLEEAEKYSLALAKALNFLSYRSRSKKEIEKKLFGCDSSVVHQVISRLDEIGLMDDRAFARQWIEERSESKGLGRRRLFSELMLKGIDREVIEEELSSLGDESERAKKLVNAKFSRMRVRSMDMHTENLRMKMYAFLARKGYDPDVARRAVVEVLKDETQEH